MVVKVKEMLVTDKPLLIVGWKKVKKLFPDQRITQKHIKENIWWTFSEREKKTEYDRDIEIFNKKCIDNIESKYKYHFFNPFQVSFTNVKNLISNISKLEVRIAYESDQHIFILMNNFVIGLNMDFFKLIKLEKNRIKSWLLKNDFVFIEQFEILNINNYLINKDYLIPCIEMERIYDKEKFALGFICE
jgi:hypothetical protein